MHVYIGSKPILLGDPEVTANLYYNFTYLYREGCVIFSIYLRLLLGHPVDALLNMLKPG